MPKSRFRWITPLLISLAVTLAGAFLSSWALGQIPVGAIVSGVAIFMATRFIRNTYASFGLSTLVVISWGFITFLAATRTSAGDLILISDDLTYWYFGIAGTAALFSLVLPSKSR